MSPETPEKAAERLARALATAEAAMPNMQAVASRLAYVVMGAVGIDYPMYFMMWNMGSNGEPEPPDTSSGSCPR